MSRTFRAGGEAQQQQSQRSPALTPIDHLQKPLHSPAHDSTTDSEAHAAPGAAMSPSARRVAGGPLEEFGQPTAATPRRAVRPAREWIGEPGVQAEKRANGGADVGAGGGGAACAPAPTAAPARRLGAKGVAQRQSEHGGCDGQDRGKGGGASAAQSGGGAGLSRAAPDAESPRLAPSVTDREGQGGAQTEDAELERRRCGSSFCA